MSEQTAAMPDTAQTWSYFLREVEATGLARPLAERAAASVMCALDQKLEELRNVYDEGAPSWPALPIRVKELLGRCACHQASPPRPFGRAEFLSMIANDLEVDEVKAELLARTVLSTVRARLTDADADHLSQNVPMDIRDLVQHSM